MACYGTLSMLCGTAFVSRRWAEDLTLGPNPCVLHLTSNILNLHRANNCFVGPNWDQTGLHYFLDGKGPANLYAGQVMSLELFASTNGPIVYWA